nr:hypothetical protein OA32_05850 [Oenococcus oeni X2L]
MSFLLLAVDAGGLKVAAVCPTDLASPLATEEELFAEASQWSALPTVEGIRKEKAAKQAKTINALTSLLTFLV